MKECFGKLDMILQIKACFILLQAKSSEKYQWK